MKRLLIFFCKLAVSALLLYWVFLGIDLDQVLAVLKGASIPLAFLAFAVMFVSFGLGAMQWRIFLKAQRLYVPPARALTYFYTGQFFNNFLLSSVGGDVVRLIDVSRGEGARSGRVLASILVDRVFSLVCLLTIGLTALPGYISLHGASAYSFTVYLYALFASAILVFWIFILSRRARYFAMRLAQHLPFARLRRVVFHLLRAFAYYRRTPGVFLRALGWGAVNQTLKIGAAFLALACLSGASGSSAGIPPSALILFIPILGMVKTLPISFMGIGPHEAAGQYLFATVGVAGDFALSFLFLYQIVAIASNTASGVFLFARRKKAQQSA